MKMLAAAGVAAGILGLIHITNARAESIELVISRWAGPHADDQAELLKQFEKETGITVKMDAIDYGQLRQKQMLNMASKTGGYDLVWAQEVWLPEYAASGFLRPLDEYVKDSALAGKDFDFSDFQPSLIKIATVDGKLYGLPTFVQTPIMVYNRDALGKAGLNAPKTWQDTLDVAKSLHSKGTGIALPAKQGLAAVDVWIALARSNGGDYFDKSGKLDLTTNANVETAAFWKDLVAVSMRGSTNWHFDDVNKALEFGQAPLGISISGLLNALEGKESTVAGKVGYSPLPYKVHPFGTLSVWNWCIPADSKHPQEAFRLLAWLTGKYAEKALSLKDGQICARQSVLKDPELVSRFPWLPAVSEALSNADTQPRTKNAPKLMDAMEAALSEIATGSAEPKAALEKVETQLAAEFQ
jgi:ABC-type glycerol-3-phosphate transport system substrate-binding protein